MPHLIEIRMLVEYEPEQQAGQPLRLLSVYAVDDPAYRASSTLLSVREIKTGWLRLSLELRVDPDDWPREPAAFADAVKKARMEAGLTRAGLAALADVSEATIRSLETLGSLPTDETRQRVIEALCRERPPE